MIKKYTLVFIALLCSFFYGFGQYDVDFEDDTKTGYASGTVTLNGINWDMTEALIGDAANDFKNGSQSARLRGRNGSGITMLANKANGIGMVSFEYRGYGTDTEQQPWALEYSLNNGSTWTQAGSDFTATATVQTFSATVDFTGNVRIRIVIASSPGTTGNRRVNIDDISITDFTGTPTYSVTYNGNGNTGGTEPTDGTAYNSGNTVTVLGNTGSLTQTCGTFINWNTASDGSGTTYNAGNTFSITSNTTLYAQWVSTNHTVTFNNNGGSGTMTPQVACTATNLTANTFTRAGFTFDKWNTASDGSGTDYADGASYNFSSDVTIYAQWIPIPSCGELFISEYHEAASGSEKYIEIYNPTSGAIDLSNYRLVQYNNADVTPTYILSLSGLLTSFDTFIIANDGGSLCPLGNGADLCTNQNIMNFNGNDAMALQTSSGTTIDIVGTVGTAANFAVDVVLRRISTVQNPNTTYTPAEWSSAPANDTSDLGNHISDCQGATPEIQLVDNTATNQNCGFTINYGTQALSSNTDLTFDIENVGSADLYITSFGITGDYTIISPATPLTITSGNSQTVTVRFTPTANGARNGVLTINNNDSNEETCTVNLTGVGFTPAPEIDVERNTLLQ